MPQPVSLFANRSPDEWIECFQTSDCVEDRYRALLAIKALSDAPTAISSCRQALVDGDSSLRALAAKQLGELRQANQPADASGDWSEIAFDLAKLIGDQDPDVRFEAARSLQRIEPKDREAKQTLMQFLDNDQTQPLMLGIVVSALAEADELDETAMIPRFRTLMTHDQPEVRENVSAAIAKFNKTARALVSELVVALEDEEPIVRENAAIALGKSSVNSTAIQTALQTAELDEDEAVANAAHAARETLSRP